MPSEDENPEVEEEIPEEVLEEIELAAGPREYPVPREKEGPWAFFIKLLKLKDSTKTAYLDDEELRVVRLLRGVSNYAEAWNLPVVRDYLKEEAEIILATSDSKHGFLIEKAVTQKRQIETAVETSERKKSKWRK